jgi:hypothetical protein
MLAAATGIAVLALSSERADAQLAVTCGGAIQNCPEGKKMYCNRWKNCKGRSAKVKRYCEAPICMTERKQKQ